MQTLQWGCWIMKDKIVNALKWFYKSFIWLFIVMLALDIITKQIIIHSGLDPFDSQSYFNWGFVHINYVLNYNAAFGIGASNHTVSRVVYLVVASLVSIGVVFYLIYRRKTMNLYVRASLVLIVTGALGNVIDRVFYGPEYAVVDWIDFYWFWPFVFNIADCCVVIAAFMLIIYIIVEEVKDYRAKNATKVTTVGESKKVLSKTEKEMLEIEEKTDEESK